MTPTPEQIQEAKNLLKKAGYFVDNLWQVIDVQENYIATEEEAQKVLDKAFINDHTQQQIFEAINDAATELNLIHKN